MKHLYIIYSIFFKKMLSLLFLLGLITKKSNQDYVNHEYNGLISPEQIITSHSNIKQISGCRFIN